MKGIILFVFLGQEGRGWFGEPPYSLIVTFIQTVEQFTSFLSTDTQGELGRHKDFSWFSIHGCRELMTDLLAMIVGIDHKDSKAVFYSSFKRKSHMRSSLFSYSLRERV